MQKPNNLILLSKHGSYLYGTDTPNSDQDFKGIYQASLKEVILGTDKETLIFNSKSLSDRSRNTKDDIDIQYKELRRFIKDALAGQIYAVDLLFSSPSHWIDSSELWLDIIKHRQKLLSSNIKPFVGYCNQQAGKYGLKGSRLAEVIRFRDWLNHQHKDNQVVWVFDKYEKSEYVQQVQLPDKAGNSVSYIKVLEKHYQLNQKCGNLASSLSNWIDKYGARSRDAMENKGVDFKAVSHAFRCVYQVTELLSTGNINFPLKQADYLKAIKAGAIEYVVLQEELQQLMDQVGDIQTVLPTEPDYDFWDDWLVAQYKQSK